MKIYFVEVLNENQLRDSVSIIPSLEESESYVEKDKEKLKNKTLVVYEAELNAVEVKRFTLSAEEPQPEPIPE